jgi:hypothetical protein
MLEHHSLSTPSYDAYALDVVLWMKQEQQEQHYTSTIKDEDSHNSTGSNGSINSKLGESKLSSSSSSSSSSIGKDKIALKLFQLFNSKHLSSSSSASSSTTTVHPFKEINTLLKLDDNNDINIYNDDTILITNRLTLSQSSFITITDKTIQTLIHISADPLPIIRAKAIRTLLQLMQVDEDLIKRDSIRITITNRLFDKAISVREETVKLLGYYVIKGR